jgi:arylsulfatase A-like enzyme
MNKITTWLALLIAGAQLQAAEKLNVLLIISDDLRDTVADCCGLQAPHTLAGQSLRPLLADSSRPGRDAAFTLVTRGPRSYGQSVRTDRWRYTQWNNGAAELYDETADPEETHNVAGDPRHAALIQELKDRLKKPGPFQPAQANSTKTQKRPRTSEPQT